MIRKSQAMLGLLLGLMAAYLPGGVPRAAAETKTVVVLPFVGQKASSARLGVIRGLKGRVEFVPADEFLSAAAERGMDIEQPEGLVTVCANLEVDAVLRGEVTLLRRGRYLVSVTVVDGGTGMPAGGKAARVRGKRRIGKAGRAIGSKLTPLIAQTSRPMVAPSEVLVEDAPVAATTAPSGGPDPEDESDDRGPAGLGGLLEVSLGLGISRRNFELEGDDPSKNRRYDGGVYPELNLRLDLYPAAPFLDHFVARNLGLGLGFAFPLSISTTLKDKAGNDQDVDTSSLEFLIDLFFRWPIMGDDPVSPDLKIAFGFGLRDFKLGENHVLPPFKYRFLRIGVDGHIPLLTPLMAVKAGIDIRPILAVGQEALDALGVKSGAFALAVRGGLGGETSFGLTYGVMVEYQHFMADYAGRVEYKGQAIPAGAPTSLRVTPSETTESYIRVWAQLGYNL